MDGRATWADLAVEADMTVPGVGQRVSRLRERGVLRGFAEPIAPESVAPTCAFVSVALEGSNRHAAFREAVLAMPEAQECRHVAGDAEYASSSAGARSRTSSSCSASGSRRSPASAPPGPRWRCRPSRRIR